MASWGQALSLSLLAPWSGPGGSGHPGPGRTSVPAAHPQGGPLTQQDPHGDTWPHRQLWPQADEAWSPCPLPITASPFRRSPGPAPWLQTVRVWGPLGEQNLFCHILDRSRREHGRWLASRYTPLAPPPARL